VVERLRVICPKDGVDPDRMVCSVLVTQTTCGGLARLAADERTTVGLGMAGVRTDVGHLRHGKEFRHGVNGSGRAPAVNLLGVRTAGWSKSGVQDIWWSIRPGSGWIRCSTAAGRR
jgi:hypothetical protein